MEDNYHKVKTGVYGKLYVLQKSSAYSPSNNHTTTLVSVLTEPISCECKIKNDNIICVYDGFCWNYSGKWKEDFETLVRQAIYAERDAANAKKREEGLRQEAIDKRLREY